jgi:tRNA threonylcarbamoyladenosine biosynthesis protein TsaB
LIVAIDTSSARSALALIDANGHVVREEVDQSGPAFDLPARYRDMTRGTVVTRVAVATGPGSFTGLRVGVSFALGVAMGLKVPVVPLATLAIQAARSGVPILAVAEAGRGRVYHLAPGREAGMAEPEGLPRDWPVAGWLRPATETALQKAGLRMAGDDELRSFGEAVARLLESALEVAYGSLEVKYMQSFSARIP